VHAHYGLSHKYVFYAYASKAFVERFSHCVENLLLGSETKQESHFARFCETEWAYILGVIEQFD
jgi:hypothetical protein